MQIIFFLKYHTNFGERLYMATNVANNECIEMQYFNDEYWRLELNIDMAQLPQKTWSYTYFLQDAEGMRIDEFHQPRQISFPDEGIEVLNIYDTWNHAGAVVNTFYTAPFQEVLLPKHPPATFKINNKPTHLFKIKAPLLKKEEAICILGDGDALHNWNIKTPHILKFDGTNWVADLELTNAQFPFAYKYGIFNQSEKEFVRFEEGGNRVCFKPASINEQMIFQDGFINIPNETWCGSGIAVPVFSLRSKSSLGVGEFSDLKLLTNWAVKTHLKLIQILPINDTTATNTWRDSYPYAAISAFALHPVYINLDEIEGKKSTALKEAIKNKRRQLNELVDVDYEAVMQFKIAVLRKLFDAASDSFQKAQPYKDFFEKNKHWLKPYAAYCFLRDQYASPNPSDWETNAVYKKDHIEQFFEEDNAARKQVLFYCYVQYQLHLQLSDAVEYARKKGIVIKGDIPIGVYRFGCDAWMAPELYKMDFQAGAPPDDFAVKGQNWGFPTYNWPQMQADNFSWWRERFEQMSRYFDAFRIDHILGFFRIWSIPLHAVQGIMGRFDPCLPIHVNEFGEQGIWFDYKRFCMPYITDEVLNEIFQEQSENVKNQFLQKHGPQQYLLLPQFDTQQKIENYFREKQNSSNIPLQDGLYNLISNVILFEEEGSEKTRFHFRIAIDQTSSFRHLQPLFREKIWNLYIDYFYRRQNNFWKEESLKKLPELKAATNMLICGEDLGMVPETVPYVMKQLGILSLEIQRMPKNPEVKFFNPANAPYLSVITPSTHDMSTVRGWWQENRNITQQFYNQELGQSGEAPQYCEPWINRAIVLQHLYSPAMWSIFQLQDILGISAELRRNNPDDERINIPANPQHYWRYRMHLTLEQLIKEKTFNEELKGYVESSGRG